MNFRFDKHDLMSSSYMQPQRRKESDMNPSGAPNVTDDKEGDRSKRAPFRSSAPIWPGEQG